MRYKIRASPVSLERYWREDNVAWKKFQCYLKTQKIKNVLELETIGTDNAGLQEVEKQQPKGDLEGVCMCKYREY